MIHTNRCKHCGKTRETHYSILLYCDKTSLAVNVTTFKDSGLAALDAHKEELWGAARNVYSVESTWHHTNRERRDAMNKLESILNQIEKEK